jgi:hypothetical protein
VSLTRRSARRAGEHSTRRGRHREPRQGRRRAKDQRKMVKGYNESMVRGLCPGVPATRALTASATVFPSSFCIFKRDRFRGVVCFPDGSPAASGADFGVCDPTPWSCPDAGVRVSAAVASARGCCPSLSSVASPATYPTPPRVCASSPVAGGGSASAGSAPVSIAGLGASTAALSP